MKVKVSQLFQYAASLGEAPIRTIGRKTTFTVEVHGTKLVFTPAGMNGRTVPRNAISEVLEIYNRHPEDLTTTTYRHFYHSSYLLALIRDLTRSEIKFDSPPRLSSKGLKLLGLIHDGFRAKTILPNRPDTYPSYTFLLKKLGLPTKPRPGKMLQNNGLDELDFWSLDLDLPPITGIIIEEGTKRPSGGFYASHRVPPRSDKDEWWKQQMLRVIDHDWSQYLVAAEYGVAADSTPVQKGPPGRTTVVITRTIRDSSIIQALKTRYERLCQRCGVPLRLLNQNYVEGHHLWPLEHGGFDEEGNVVCVCANCHVLLDYAAVPFHVSELKCVKHIIDQQNVDHHNYRYAEAQRKLSSQT